MRIVGLDILRSFAILLVLIRHGQMTQNPVYDFGWLGVDLFFVLSGFLVSGLIFKEYKKRGKLNIKRFLVRRGFKIYPPFYIFLIGSIVIEHYRDGFVPTWQTFLGEALYMQSYLRHIWSHTWSLAVEEHFYLGLALISFIGYKLQLISKKQLVIGSLLFLIVASFFLRVATSYPHRFEPFYGFMQTHLRSDGILIGVLISYLYHFTTFFAFFEKRRWFFIALAIPLLLPGFIYHGGSYEMNTFGLSTVNLGFGIITLFALTKFPTVRFQAFIQPIISFLCLIGKHSYSIYLWHIACRNLMNDHFHFGATWNSYLYFALSIFVGIVLSLIIERPFLLLREKVSS